MHYGYLHTSLKHLLGPVVQYEDTVQGQTSFVFLLRCVCDLEQDNETLNYQCLDNTWSFQSIQSGYLEDYYKEFIFSTKDLLPFPCIN